MFKFLYVINVIEYQIKALKIKLLSSLSLLEQNISIKKDKLQNICQLSGDLKERKGTYKNIKLQPKKINGMEEKDLSEYISPLCVTMK